MGDDSIDTVVLDIDTAILDIDIGYLVTRSQLARHGAQREVAGAVQEARPLHGVAAQVEIKSKIEAKLKAIYHILLSRA